MHNHTIRYLHNAICRCTVDLRSSDNKGKDIVLWKAGKTEKEVLRTSCGRTGLPLGANRFFRNCPYLVSNQRANELECLQVKDLGDQKKRNR